VIVVRDEAGVLRAHANFCRHRGSLLLTGTGNQRSIRCPYHAWVYKLSGALAGAPSMRETPGFDKDGYGLIPVRLETWEGFVFLNFDNTAPSLLDDLGNLPDLLRSHRMHEMVCTWRFDVEAHCNWKLLVENATETYHTGTVHAATVGAQKSISFPAIGQWMGLQVLSAGSIAALDGRAALPHIEGLSEQARQGTFFVFLHPTTQFACAQDCVWWLTTRPVAPDRTVLSIGGCFPKAFTELPDFTALALPYYERWERVAREDIGILEHLQIACGSAHYVPGPLSWRDDLVHAFDQWVLARAGQPAAAAPPAP
jgi:phenylpropionate dioxygenase-like ring-hydroxylating dioxygenase large terminal subunit